MQSRGIDACGKMCVCVTLDMVRLIFLILHRRLIALGQLCRIGLSFAQIKCIQPKLNVRFSAHTHTHRTKKEKKNKHTHSPAKKRCFGRPKLCQQPLQITQHPCWNLIRHLGIAMCAMCTPICHTKSKCVSHAANFLITFDVSSLLSGCRLSIFSIAITMLFDHVDMSCCANVKVNSFQFPFTKTTTTTLTDDNKDIDYINSVHLVGTIAREMTGPNKSGTYRCARVCVSLCVIHVVVTDNGIWRIVLTRDS